MSVSGEVEGECCCCTHGFRRSGWDDIGGVVESWEDVEDVDDDRVDSTVGTRGMGIPLVLLSLEWTDEAFSPEDLNAERKDWIMLTLVEVEEVSFG